MVFRVEKNKNYTTMSNYHFRDQRLSLKAVGLLSKILYLPDDWKYSIEGLSQICKEGKTAIRSAIEELEECGYIVRKKIKNEKGLFDGYEYIVYECPQNLDNTESEPSSENLTTDDSMTENSMQLNTNIINTNIPTTTTKKDSIVFYERYGKNHLVKLTAEEIQRLYRLFGVERVALMIQRLDCYICERGTFYPSHFETISKWIVEDDSKVKSCIT